MAYEYRDGQGSLFKNDKREKDTHPNARGRAMIGGVMYFVDAWTKDGANGKWQSLSFKPCDQQPAAKTAPTATTGASGFADMDEDVPFN